ncbi:Uncharacterized protein APZ42_026319 [Daphnia magna]|uniref:Uncharacterized protein n=1 Tax=Daphnia magna TaxID=35525 RepID=A0A164SCQ1_9CRUS|nr:Uncharacterized protein APZ42_026319 [Daphnia magna]
MISKCVRLQVPVVSHWSACWIETSLSNEPNFGVFLLKIRGRE